MGRNPPGMGNYIVTQLYPVKMNPSLRLGFQGKINDGTSHICTRSVNKYHA